MKDKNLTTMKTYWTLFCLFGFFSVALGAFGAHALKGSLESKFFEIFQTGVTYQFYHTFALGFVLILAQTKKDFSYKLSALFFIIGILIFSGSLYLLAITQIKWLGAITPIGGVFFLLGWLSFAYNVFKIKTATP